jgi:hypothetical protein
MMFLFRGRVRSVARFLAVAELYPRRGIRLREDVFPFRLLLCICLIVFCFREQMRLVRNDLVFVVRMLNRWSRWTGTALLRCGWNQLALWIFDLIDDCCVNDVRCLWLYLWL